MLKVDQSRIDRMESSYPGIAAQIRRFDAAKLPPCSHCGSPHTADVQVGVIGRTINLAVATTKFRLIANGPKPGSHFCNQCKRFFSTATHTPKT
jgi:hypothetical protein